MMSIDSNDHSELDGEKAFSEVVSMDFLTAHEQDPERAACAVEQLLLDQTQFDLRVELLDTLAEGSSGALESRADKVAEYQAELQAIRDYGVIDSIIDNRVKAQRMAQILGAPSLLAAAREALLKFIEETATTTEPSPESQQIAAAEFVKNCLRDPEAGCDIYEGITHLVDDPPEMQASPSGSGPTPLIDSTSGLYRVQQAFFDGFQQLKTEIGLELPQERPQEHWQAELFLQLVGREAIQQYWEQKRWLEQLRSRCDAGSLAPIDRMLTEMFPDLAETDLNGERRVMSYRLFMRERLRRFLSQQTWVSKDFDLETAMGKLTRDRLGELLQITVSIGETEQVEETAEFSLPELCAVVDLG